MGITSEKSDDWQSCESGYLVSLSKRAKGARRKRLVLRAGAGAAVLVFAVGVGLWSTGIWPMPREHYYAGIACHEVQENIPAMIAGALPEDLRARMEAHLQQCPTCREMLENMQGKPIAASVLHNYRECACPECRRQAMHMLARTGRLLDEGAVRRPESRRDLAFAEDQALVASR